MAQLWAACAGDSVVAVGTDGALTGADVRDLARRIAAAVRGHGVGVSDRVAILLPRGARLLPAILGVWSAGASYVPLDPIYPAQRLATMLGDCGRGRDRGRQRRRRRAGPAARRGADTGRGPGRRWPPAGAEPAEPVLDLPPSAVAVTIFTSGSTGRPKAVSVTQGGIATLLDAVRPMLALGPEDRFVAVSTFAFDIALVELLAPVLAGGCVVIADAEQVLDAARLRELLTDSGATALQATPAGWRMLVDAGGIPAGVRLRMTAGEPLPRDLADAMGAGTGVRAVEPVRPDRDHDLLGRRRRRLLAGPDRDRVDHRGDPAVRARRPAAAGPARRLRGGLHRRRRGRPRLSRRARHDRGPVRPRPVQRTARRAPVPDRRRRPVAQRPGGSSWPAGRTGRSRSAATG